MEQERRRRTDYRRKRTAGRRRGTRREPSPGYAQKLGNTLLRQIMLSAIVLVVALGIKSMSGDKQESVEVFMNDAMNRNVTLEDLNNKLADMSAESDFVQAVFAAINPNKEDDEQKPTDQDDQNAANGAESTPQSAENTPPEDQDAGNAAQPDTADAAQQKTGQHTAAAGSDQPQIQSMMAAAHSPAAEPEGSASSSAGGGNAAMVPGLISRSGKFMNLLAVPPDSQPASDSTAQGEDPAAASDTDTDDGQDAAPPHGQDPSAADSAAPVEEQLTQLAEQNVSTYMAGISSVPNTLLYGIQIPDQAFALPVSSGEITSEFGTRIDPIDGSEAGFHGGLDIACEADKNAPIHAALAGTVEDVGYEESYGNYVKIRHTDELETLYAHCESVQVKPGDAVEKDQVIARQGMSGRATWYHVHFEVRYLGERVNPIEYVPAYLSM